MHQFFEKNMKIPFYTVIGPILRKNKLTINHVCVHPLLTFAPIYVGVLGVLGVVLSAFDIYRIVKYGSVLPSYIWKGGLSKEKFITSEAERNCKLVSLVLSVEYYLFLLLGFFTNSPIFYMPFLVLYPLIIFLDIIVFITSVFVDGFILPKKALIMTIFMIYNWSSWRYLIKKTTIRRQFLSFLHWHPLTIDSNQFCWPKQGEPSKKQQFLFYCKVIFSCAVVCTFLTLLLSAMQY